MASHGSISLGMLCTIFMTAGQVFAQSDNLPTRYDSSDNVDRPANWNYATPEDDARPGEKFYFRGVHAFQKKDYSFAVNMYQVASSWGYKPAQYNLAIMYLKGQGIPVDRQRAMAWMALAAERNDPQYVQARELIYADLTPDEFAHANEIWRELKPTYGDDVALARAKMRWAQVRAAMTGSHVGGVVGNLQVGAAGGSVRPGRLTPSGRSEVSGFATSGGMLLGGGSEEGSTSYHQLRDSDNPYDPKFEWRDSPYPTGTATVGPIGEVDAGSGTSEQAKKPDPKQHDFF